MDSVLQQLASDMAGKAIIGIIPQSERELFKTYNVRGIPATFIFHNSEVKQSYLGFQNKEVLAKSLNKYGS